MAVPSRLAMRLRPWSSIVTTRSFAAKAAPPATKEEPWPQRTPLGGYYESILNNPSPYPFEKKPEEPPNSADPEVIPPEKKPDAAPEPAPRPAKKKPGRKPKSTATSAATNSAAESASSPSPSPSTSPPAPSPPPTSAQEKARVVFGTRLAGPDDRATHLATKKAQSTYIGGILVPPQPEEPDNCCMSGCVNCVWDLFREDMEEWTAKKAEAERRVRAAAAESVDSDGGGSETNWGTPTGGVQVGEAKIAKDLWDDDVFANVPVGIREFMKQEKRLKERHEREGTSGG